MHSFKIEYKQSYFMFVFLSVLALAFFSLFVWAFLDMQPQSQTKSMGLYTLPFIGSVVLWMYTCRLVAASRGYTKTIELNQGVLSFPKSAVSRKRVSINFNNEDRMKVGYNATFDLAYMQLSVMGDFDLEELITSCSGLLCIAARALKGENNAYDVELKKVMGY
jgi:hypothetical protein